VTNLTTVQELEIEENPALATMDFSALTMNTGNFRLIDNESLSSASFTNLEVSSGTFEIENNGNLASLSFPALKSVGNQTDDHFSITNGTFTLFDFSSLETVIGSSFIIENNNFDIDELSFPALEKVGSENTTTFDLKNNNGIRGVAFPSLQEVVNGDISILGTFVGRYFFGNLTTFSSFENIVDTVLTRLVAITPPITGTTIELDGVASAEGLVQIQTLRDNGNVVTVEPF